MGQLWQSELLFFFFCFFFFFFFFFWEICSKNTGLQGSTLSGPRMTMGFGPFELPTHGLLQKGRDHSPPKFLLCEEPSFLVGTAIIMGIHSGMNIRITKQIGGGVNEWSYYDDIN